MDQAAVVISYSNAIVVFFQTIHNNKKSGMQSAFGVRQSLNDEDLVSILKI